MNFRSPRPILNWIRVLPDHNENLYPKYNTLGTWAVDRVSNFVT